MSEHEVILVELILQVTPLCLGVRWILWGSRFVWASVPEVWTSFNATIPCTSNCFGVLSLSLTFILTCIMAVDLLFRLQSKLSVCVSECIGSICSFKLTLLITLWSFKLLCGIICNLLLESFLFSHSLALFTKLHEIIPYICDWILTFHDLCNTTISFILKEHLWFSMFENHHIRYIDLTSRNSFRWGHKLLHQPIKWFCEENELFLWFYDVLLSFLQITKIINLIRINYLWLVRNLLRLYGFLHFSFLIEVLLQEFLECLLILLDCFKCPEFLFVLHLFGVSIAYMAPALFSRTLLWTVIFVTSSSQVELFGIWIIM